jgi:thioredoxin
MGIDVTDQSFITDVIEESMKRPVLVDFWAEWCGPCRMLGPVLGKLETAYNGRFLLAKLDTDHNQKTAQEYQISGIPAVKLFHLGKVVDEFVGALPESRVKSFLDKNIPDPAIEKIKTQAESDPVKAAQDLIESGATAAVPDVYWKAIMAILRSEGRSTLPSMNLHDSLKTLLKYIPEVGNEYSDPGKWLTHVINYSPELTNPLRIGNAFGNNVIREDLEYFINKVSETSGEEREYFRDALLVIFFNIRDSKDTVTEYRRRLSALLF